MIENSEEPRALIAAIKARSGIILGVAGLIAWLTLVWFMFHDML